MATSTGVFPCYENQFWVNTSATSTEKWETILDCETFEVAFDNGVEEWTPFDSEGWTRRLMTAKSVTITVTAKRNLSTTTNKAGNNFIASLWDKNGESAQADFKWQFPDGTVAIFKDSPINITALGSGDSTAVAPLEFEVLSNGKPTIGTAS